MIWCETQDRDHSRDVTGQINIPNLAEPYSAVCSGLTGLLFSGILTVSVSLMSKLDVKLEPYLCF